MTLNLKVARILGTKGFTQGRLFVNEAFECHTLEDEVRNGPKIYGETAIPVGRYKVIVSHSNHFNRELPLLVDVPNYEGVRIHPGNTAKDTLGCILVGVNLLPASVGPSVPAFNSLFQKIMTAWDAKEEIWIELL